MTSNISSLLVINSRNADIVVGVNDKMACKLAELCDNLSSGSDCGKNMQPRSVVWCFVGDGSNRKPTDFKITFHARFSSQVSDKPPSSFLRLERNSLKFNNS